VKHKKYIQHNKQSNQNKKKIVCFVKHNTQIPKNNHTFFDKLTTQTEGEERAASTSPKWKNSTDRERRHSSINKPKVKEQHR